MKNKNKSLIYFELLDGFAKQKKKKKKLLLPMANIWSFEEIIKFQVCEPNNWNEQQL